MRVEVMEHYGLTQSIDQAGYYETAHHKQLMKDIKGAIREGRLIAVCGVVGSGKTVTWKVTKSNVRCSLFAVRSKQTVRFDSLLPDKTVRSSLS